MRKKKKPKPALAGFKDYYEDVRPKAPRRSRLARHPRLAAAGDTAGQLLRASGQRLAELAGRTMRQLKRRLRNGGRTRT